METDTSLKFKDVFWELLSERNDGNQMKFSTETGIPVTTVNGWLKGNRLPRLEQLVAIASYFDVSIDYLAGRDGEPTAQYFGEGKTHVSRRNRLKRRIDGLNEEELNLAEDFLALLEAAKTRSRP